MMALFCVEDPCISKHCNLAMPMVRGPIFIVGTTTYGAAMNPKLINL